MSLIGYKFTTLHNAAGFTSNYPGFITEELKNKLNFEKFLPYLTDFIIDKNS
jgi:hypothetical protein